MAVESRTDLSGRSSGLIRTNAELIAVIVIGGKSSSASRGFIILRESAIISGRSSSETRTIIDLALPARVAGKSSTLSRMALGLDAAAALGLRSASNTRAEVKLDVTAIPVTMIEIVVEDQPVVVETTQSSVEIGVEENQVSLEVIILPTLGNTIRITATFSADLDSDPEIIVYDSNRNIIDTLATNKAGTGIYYADYIVPKESVATIEASGELERWPQVGRIAVNPTWLSD